MQNNPEAPAADRDLKYEMMTDYPPSLAAIKQLKTPVPLNFAFYEFKWLDDGKADVMRVKGAVFRSAKTGKRRGQRAIVVPDTTVTVYVTQAEIQEEASHGMPS